MAKKDDAVSKKALDICEAARAQLILRYPFVGRLGIQIPFVPVSDSRIHTIATNGKVIYIRPDWVCSMPPVTMLALIAHTVWTAALCHSFRRDERTADRFDLASDLEVYTLLRVEDVPKVRKPDFFEKFPRHLPVEDIYAKLPDTEYFRFHDSDVHLYSAGKVSLPALPVKNSSEEVQEDKKKDKKSSGSASGKDCETDKGDASGSDSETSPTPAVPDGGREGETSYGSGDDELHEADCECDPAVREVWRQRIIEAGQSYKMAYGKLPGELEELVEFFSQSKTDYLQILRRYLSLCSGGESSWLPPARRFVWQKSYLPSHRNPKLEVVIALDTSGSISGEDFRNFFGEITAVVQSFPNYELTLVQCDSRIEKVEKFSREKPFSKTVPLTLYGRGGTSFSPVFEYVKNEKINPKVLIYYTDGGDAHFPEKPPAYPVIWALTKDKTVPWGKKIVMADNRK
ncbi:MAG: hypothetical protein IJC27_01025 [Lentisphaeria bacterium]|nr:hypothetical protein [Lentisphaeria bacterium]